MLDRIVGAVLAGGRSSRMGSEKPLVEIGGRLLIERVLDAVSPCVAEVVLVTNRPELYGFLGVQAIPDTHPGRGPLAGIHSALGSLRGYGALVVACDYPFLDAQSLRKITREDPGGGVVLPQIEGRLHPLCALYATKALTAVEQALANGELMVLSLVARLPQRILFEDELGGAAAARTFFNVNTPEDLRRAEEMLAQAQPRG